MHEEFWSAHSAQENFLPKIFGRPIDILKISRRLITQPVDIMVVTTTHDWKAILRDVPLLVATRFLCRKIVLQFHGSYSSHLVRPGNRLMKILTWIELTLSDAVLLLSREEIKEWSQFFPKREFFFVDNPNCLEISDSDVDPLSFRSTWNILPSTNIILFVGRLVEEKGIYDLLAAARRLKQNRVPFHLLLAGDGPECANLAKRIADSGLQNEITLLGYVNGLALQAAYKTAKILVLPSWREGFPLVLMEALWYGLPIVTTRIRGAADRLEDRKHALFVEPKNPEQLASAIQTLLMDDELTAQMSINNLEKVRDYEPALVIDRYALVLRQIVS